MFIIRTNRPNRRFQKRWSAYATIENWTDDQYKEARYRMKIVESLLASENPTLSSLDYCERRTIEQGLTFSERVFIADCLSGRSGELDRKLMDILNEIPRIVSRGQRKITLLRWSC